MEAAQISDKAVAARIHASENMAHGLHIMHARIIDGPNGFGKCLVATRDIRCGEIVMEEMPLLRGDPLSSLPPIGAFASLKAAAPLPKTAHEIGGAAWPRESTFDSHTFGLLLAFIEADVATKHAVLFGMQHQMERAPNEGLPEISAAEETARLAEQALRERGAPWLAEDWDLPAEWTVELEGADGSGVLARLLRIFAISAMPFEGGGALYRVASKLAHACHGANVGLQTDGMRGLGIFTAMRHIPMGTLLTHPYLTMNLSLTSTPLRRRVLYCQRGMFCLCSSCVGPDWLRLLPSPCGTGALLLHQKGSAQAKSAGAATWQCTCRRCMARESDAQSNCAEQADEATVSLLRGEEVLAGAVFELYARVDVEKPRCLAQAQQTQLTELRYRCEDQLGAAHWSTQVSMLCSSLTLLLCCASSHMHARVYRHSVDLS